LAALDFPSSPSDGQTYSANGLTYSYSASTAAWKLVTTSVVTGILTSPIETVTTSATASTGTINFDVKSQSILYYTTNASANFSLNLRGDSSTTLNTLLTTGQSVSVAFMNTNGATPYYLTGITVDTNATTTVKWQGQAATAGNASAIDVYTVTVIKTGTSTFTALISQSKFA
jgi:hypothetical protein